VCFNKNDIQNTFFKSNKINDLFKCNFIIVKYNFYKILQVSFFKKDNFLLKLKIIAFLSQRTNKYG